MPKIQFTHCIEEEELTGVSGQNYICKHQKYQSAMCQWPGSIYRNLNLPLLCDGSGCARERETHTHTVCWRGGEVLALILVTSQQIFKSHPFCWCLSVLCSTNLSEHCYQLHFVLWIWHRQTEQFNKDKEWSVQWSWNDIYVWSLWLQMINIIIIIIIIFNIFFLALDETVYASSVCLLN